MNDKMYEYLLEHNYISRNKNKSSFRQQELSENRAQCIACKCNSLFEEERENLIKYLEDKIKYIKSNCSQIGGNWFNMSYMIEAYEDILEKVRNGNYE